MTCGELLPILDRANSLADIAAVKRTPWVRIMGGLLCGEGWNQAGQSRPDKP
jgi:hypothetical protein